MYVVNTIKGKHQILHHAGSHALRTVTSVADATDAARLADALTDLEATADPERARAKVLELSAAVPSAVGAAVRAELDRYAPGVERTWTFFGHWCEDEIVVEFTQPGQVEDYREDDGTWTQGLWAAAAAGGSIAQARARAVAPYETDAQGECTVCRGTRLAFAAGADRGPMFACWNCTTA